MRAARRATGASDGRRTARRAGTWQLTRLWIPCISITVRLVEVLLRVDASRTDHHASAMPQITARRALVRACQVALLPLLVLCRLEASRGRGERLFSACTELLSLLPGWTGSLVRRAFYAATLEACSDHAYISFGTVFAHRAARVGRSTFIGPYGVIGSATIGDGVKIGSRVSILSGRHQHSSRPGNAATDQPTFSSITIGAGAWIGEGAIVMANVGRNAIIGAGAVVVRDVPDGATVVGNPARVIATPELKLASPAEADTRTRVARG